MIVPGNLANLKRTEKSATPRMHSLPHFHSFTEGFSFFSSTRIGTIHIMCRTTALLCCAAKGTCATSGKNQWKDDVWDKGQGMEDEGIILVMVIIPDVRRFGKSSISDGQQRDSRSSVL
jgi:hypothetical protein